MNTWKVSFTSGYVAEYILGCGSIAPGRLYVRARSHYTPAVGDVHRVYMHAGATRPRKADRRKVREWMHTIIQRHGLDVEPYTIRWVRAYIHGRLDRRGPRSYLHRNISDRLPEDMLEFNHTIMINRYMNNH